MAGVDVWPTSVNVNTEALGYEEVSTYLAGAYGPLTPNGLGATLYGYGSSFVAGGGDSTAAAAYVTRVGTTGGFSTTTNRGESGAAATQNAMGMLAGYPTAGNLWTPSSSTKGIFIIDSIINCVQLWGDQTKGYNACRNALRTMIGLAQAKSKADDTTFTYSASWTAATGSGVVFASGSTTHFATADNETCDISVTISSSTGTDVTVVLVGKDSSASGAVGGTAQILVDGVLNQTVTLSDQAITYALTDTTTKDFGPFPVRITGLAVGAHTIRVKKVSGGVVYVDCVLVSKTAATCPGVVLVKDVGRVSSPGGFGWATSSAPNASNTTLASYNAIVDSVASEFSNVVVADPSVGFDYTPGVHATSTDGKHPNDAGMALYTSAVMRAVRSLGYSSGWNTL